MNNFALKKSKILKDLIEQDLKPYVKKIDVEAFYAENFLKKLGEAGLFASVNKSQKELILDGMHLVEETAKTCMTTAFCLWCHLAALTYVRNTSNEVLHQKFLPLLENGEILAATGLSNPMKYYAGLEDLHLSAEPTEGGYFLSGVLPAVSNLGENHWIGVVAAVNENKRVMCFVPCQIEGLKMKGKVEFLGVNGSATYSCQFSNVFIPKEWVLSEDADEFVKAIRPTFVLYQLPLGVGVTKESISSIDHVEQRQNGCNRYLKKQAYHILNEVQQFQKKIEVLFEEDLFNWTEIAKLRLEIAYLTLDAVQANMLHCGSSGYLNECASSRRLREAYFFANLTPTVKHLEKIVNSYS
ncbi:acyl-CoA dehydrogenase family protein [Schinkia azotoformans]|uniref:acyl-CoA dehydrogenase family protein n=1 Tax=Schinkia azotoformans TaxID=1454 RepID=UPI002DBE9AE6|nr:acyl-CoA dehydrogenase family protein [Schinkia azotoformans]MEC1721518.1 acyl-CoA/acyl-ACP dehydrogenase [Schinkia azotoformans]MED4413683.1 acyl-CoA/acyl-ACP dehydrogenase [Schinkia azotoformans]